MAEQTLKELLDSLFPRGSRSEEPSDRTIKALDLRRRGAASEREKDKPPTVRRIGRELYPDIFPEREVPSPSQAVIDTLRGGTPEEVVKAYEKGKGDRDTALGKLAGGMEVFFGEDVGQLKSMDNLIWSPIKRKIEKNQIEFNKQFQKGSKARKVGDAITGISKEGINLAQVMFGTRGGLLTLGAGGALAPLAKGGSTTASLLSGTGHAAFATTIVDGVNQNKEHLADVLYGVNEDGTPKYSDTEKAEAKFGLAAAAVFSAALARSTGSQYKAAVKKNYGVDVYKGMPIEEAAKARRIIEEKNKTEEQMLEQEARELEFSKKTEKPMLEQEARELEMAEKAEKAKKAKKDEAVVRALPPWLTSKKKARELELARKVEEAKKAKLPETTIPEQEIIEMARAEKAKEAETTIPEQEIIEMARAERAAKEAEPTPPVEVDFVRDIVGGWTTVWGNPAKAMVPFFKKVTPEILSDIYNTVAEKHGKKFAEMHTIDKGTEYYKPPEGEVRRSNRYDFGKVQDDLIYNTIREVLEKHGIKDPMGKRLQGEEYKKQMKYILAEKGPFKGSYGTLYKVPKDVGVTMATPSSVLAHNIWDYIAQTGKAEKRMSIEEAGRVLNSMKKSWEGTDKISDALDAAEIDLGKAVDEYHESGVWEPSPRAEAYLFATKGKLARETPKPTDPVIESLKEEKVDPVVESLKEEKIEADPKAEIIEVEAGLRDGPLVTEHSKKYHSLIKEAMKSDKEAGDSASYESWRTNPDSQYAVYPSSKWAAIVGKMPIDKVKAAIGEAAGEQSPLMMIMRRRVIKDLRDNWKRTDKESDRNLYEAELQALSNETTFLGQLIEVQKYFRIVDADLTIDLIESALVKSGGEKLTKSERTSLEGMIEKASQSRAKSTDSTDAYRKDPTKENAEIVSRDVLSAELDYMKQVDFIHSKNPPLAADLIISFMQGNFLTPTTLPINILGNVVPLLPRAAARGVAGGLDFVGQLFSKTSREKRLYLLKAEQAKKPTTKRALEIARLEKTLSPMEQTVLSPLRGTTTKAAGMFRGIGFQRLYAAMKEAAKNGVSPSVFWVEDAKASRGKSGPLREDALSSLVIGNRLHKYEVGHSDPTTAKPQVDAFRAGGRLIKLIFSGKENRKKISRNTETVVKDFVEAVGGFFPTVFFRLLAAGDVPFRGGELQRLIHEQVMIKSKPRAATKWTAKQEGWSKERIDRALDPETPMELEFTEAEILTLKNRAARASFQQENWGTEIVSWFNKLIRGKKRKHHREASYVGYRSLTPYQQTLVNYVGEFLNFTPLGLVDLAVQAKRQGLASKDAKNSAGKIITGTTVLAVADHYLNNDIISADLNPQQAVDAPKKVRYMTENAFSHGFINLSAAARMANGEDTAYRKGDWEMDLRRMGPTGSLLSNSANWHRTLERLPDKQRKKMEEGWHRLLTGGGLLELAKQSYRSSVNETMLTGVRDLSRLISAFAEDKSTGHLSGQLARNLTAVFFPNTFGWWTKKGKSKYKQSFSPDEDEFWPQVSEGLINDWRIKTSALSSDEFVEGFPIIADMWGTPLRTVPDGSWMGIAIDGWIPKPLTSGPENEATLMNRLFASTFNILRIKKTGGGKNPAGEFLDPASSEVYRLWRKFSDSGAVPSIPNKLITVDGKNYALNRDQYAYYSALSGQYRLNGKGEVRTKGAIGVEEHDGIMNYIVHHPNYENVPDDVKLKNFQGIYSTGLSNARKDSFEFFSRVGKMTDKEIAEVMNGPEIKLFNINVKRLPIKPEQEIKDPSGRRFQELRDKGLVDFDE